MCLQLTLTTRYKRWMCTLMFSTTYPPTLRTPPHRHLLHSSPRTFTLFAALFFLSLRALSADPIVFLHSFPTLCHSFSLPLLPSRFCISFIRLNMRLFLPLCSVDAFVYSCMCVRTANKDCDENKRPLIVQSKTGVIIIVASISDIILRIVWKEEEI